MKQKWQILRMLLWNPYKFVITIILWDVIKIGDCLFFRFRWFFGPNIMHLGKFKFLVSKHIAISIIRSFFKNFKKWTTLACKHWTIGEIFITWFVAHVESFLNSHMFCTRMWFILDNDLVNINYVLGGMMLHAWLKIF